MPEPTRRHAVKAGVTIAAHPSARPNLPPVSQRTRPTRENRPSVKFHL